MARLVDGILEIEGHYRGQNVERYVQALDFLRQSSFDGHRVLGVVDSGFPELEDRCVVPHFGHDCRCGNKCKAEPAPHGIHRYFGVSLLLEGEVTIDIFGTYELASWAQFDLCGITDPAEEHTERERVEKSAVA